MLPQPREGIAADRPPRHRTGAAEGVIRRRIPDLAAPTLGMTAERQAQPGDHAQDLPRQLHLALADELHRQPGLAQRLQDRFGDETGPHQHRAGAQRHIRLAPAQALNPGDHGPPLILRRLAAAREDRGAGRAGGIRRTQDLAQRLGVAGGDGIGGGQDRAG